MGITERHWFEDEEPELTERQLEDVISIQDRFYRRGYHKGYSDGVKEQEEKMKHLNNITFEYEKEVFRLQTLLKEQENQKNLILKVVWDVLHEGVSTDTIADQDWVYERIRNRIEKDILMRIRSEI